MPLLGDDFACVRDVTTTAYKRAKRLRVGSYPALPRALCAHAAGGDMLRGIRCLALARHFCFRPGADQFCLDQLPLYLMHN